MRNLKKYLVLRKAILWFLAPALICLFHAAEIATGVRRAVQEHQIRDLVEKGV